MPVSPDATSLVAASILVAANAPAAAAAAADVAVQVRLLQSLACTVHLGTRPDAPDQDSRRCVRRRHAWAAAAGAHHRGTAARTVRRHDTAVQRWRDAVDACGRTRCCGYLPNQRLSTLHRQQLSMRHRGRSCQQYRFRTALTRHIGPAEIDVDDVLLNLSSSSCTDDDNR